MEVASLSPELVAGRLSSLHLTTPDAIRRAVQADPLFLARLFPEATDEDEVQWYDGLNLPMMVRRLDELARVEAAMVVKVGDVMREQVREAQWCVLRGGSWRQPGAPLSAAALQLAEERMRRLAYIPLEAALVTYLTSQLTRDCTRSAAIRRHLDDVIADALGEIQTASDRTLHHIHRVVEELDASVVQAWSLAMQGADLETVVRCVSSLVAMAGTIVPVGGEDLLSPALVERWLRALRSTRSMGDWMSVHASPEAWLARPSWVGSGASVEPVVGPTPAPPPLSMRRPSELWQSFRIGIGSGTPMFPSSSSPSTPLPLPTLPPLPPALQKLFRSQPPPSAATAPTTLPPVDVEAWLDAGEPAPTPTSAPTLALLTARCSAMRITVNARILQSMLEERLLDPLIRLLTSLTRAATHFSVHRWETTLSEVNDPTWFRCRARPLDDATTLPSSSTALHAQAPRDVASLLERTLQLLHPLAQEFDDRYTAYFPSDSISSLALATRTWMVCTLLPIMPIDAVDSGLEIRLQDPVYVSRAKEVECVRDWLRHLLRTLRVTALLVPRATNAAYACMSAGLPATLSLSILAASRAPQEAASWAIGHPSVALHPSDILVPCLQLLAPLAEIPQTAELLCSTFFVGKLIALLREWMAAPGTAVQAAHPVEALCRALRQLVLRAGHQQEALLQLTEPCISLLWALGGKQPRATQAACDLLAAIAALKPTGEIHPQRTMTSLSAAEALATVLNRWCTEDAAVVSSCMVAITELCRDSDEAKTRFGEANGCAYLMQAVRQAGSTSASAAIECFRCVVNVAAQHTGNKLRLGAAQAPAILFDLTRQWRRVTVEISIYACWSVTTLCFGCPENVARCLDAGWLDMVYELWSEWGMHSAPVPENACKALQQLMVTPVQWAQLMRRRILTLWTMQMTRWANQHVGCCDALCCWMLHAVSIARTTWTSDTSGWCVHSSIPVLVQALNTWNDRKVTMQRVGHVLEALADSPWEGLRLHMIRHHACEEAIDLAAQKNDDDLTVVCCRILASLWSRGKFDVERHQLAFLRGTVMGTWMNLVDTFIMGGNEAASAEVMRALVSVTGQRGACQVLVDRRIYVSVMQLIVSYGVRCESVARDGFHILYELVRCADTANLMADVMLQMNLLLNVWRHWIQKAQGGELPVNDGRGGRDTLKTSQLLYGGGGDGAMGGLFGSGSGSGSDASFHQSVWMAVGDAEEMPSAAPSGPYSTSASSLQALKSATARLVAQFRGESHVQTLWWGGRFVLAFMEGAMIQVEVLSSMGVVEMSIASAWCALASTAMTAAQRSEMLLTMLDLLRVCTRGNESNQLRCVRVGGARLCAHLLAMLSDPTTDVTNDVTRRTLLVVLTWLEDMSTSEVGRAALVHQDAAVTLVTLLRTHHGDVELRRALLRTCVIICRAPPSKWLRHADANHPGAMYRLRQHRETVQAVRAFVGEQWVSWRSDADTCHYALHLMMGSRNRLPAPLEGAGVGAGVVAGVGAGVGVRGAATWQTSFDAQYPWTLTLWAVAGRASETVAP